MDRVSVSSSNLASVGYDPEKLLLEIEFNEGSIYQYFNVPQIEFNQLMRAESHGEYFSEYIRDTFDYEQIR